MPQKLSWSTIVWLLLMHLSALTLGWFTFTWKGLLICGCLFFVTGWLGICLNYHRQLTHGSFKTHHLTRWLLTIVGSLAGEGPPIAWVATHRLHHRCSDKPGHDPHTPLEYFKRLPGFSWSHIAWMFFITTPNGPEAFYDQYASDLSKDRMISFISRTFLMWHALLASALWLLGWLIWDMYTACSLLVWGMAVRMVLVWHCTWLVNSATHLWGYRRYETRDNSRNNVWVALVTGGEGWHNNHHHYPTAANHGHTRWEIDPVYWTIVVMSWFGLAWDIRKCSLHNA